MSDYPRELIADLKDGVVVPFVGAGMSIPSGLPTWGQLIEQLFDELQSEGEVKKLRERYRSGALGAHAVSEIYTAFKAKHALLAFLKRKLGGPARPNEYHRLLYDLDARTIITSNFDNLIEDAHNAQGQGLNKIWKNEQLAFYNERQAVQLIKVHGTIEDVDTIVFSKSDYESFKRERALIFHFVATLFATKTILFLGTSLNDPHLKDIFDDVRARTGPAMRPHYALMNRPSPETRGALLNYGIETLDLNADEPDLKAAHISWLKGFGESVGRSLSLGVSARTDAGAEGGGSSLLTIVVGDRREDPPESPGDFLAVTPSTRDLTWICALGLQPSTIIWNDKIAVATKSDDEVPELLRARDLLIVGSPYCNLVARRVNKTAFFRFNIDPDDLSAIEEVERKIRGLKRQEADLVRIRKELTDYVELVSKLRGHGLVDIATQKSAVGGFREKDEDFATITLCEHPYSNNHVAVLVAGIGLPGTMAAVKTLSAPDFFQRRPFGGIIKVVIPPGGWYERLTRGTPEWITPVYGNKDLFKNLGPAAPLATKGIYTTSEVDRYRDLVQGQYRETTVESILRRWTGKQALWTSSAP